MERIYLDYKILKLKFDVKSKLILDKILIFKDRELA